MGVATRKSILRSPGPLVKQTRPNRALRAGTRRAQHANKFSGRLSEPTRSLLGLRARDHGITLNTLLLFKLPLKVVTVTKPVVAPVGTFAVR
jgi:hypothetical protein